MIPRMYDPLDPYHPANLMPHLFGRVEDEGPSPCGPVDPAVPPDVSPWDLAPGRPRAGQVAALLVRVRRGALLSIALVSLAAAVVRVVAWMA